MSASATTHTTQLYTRWLPIPQFRANAFGFKGAEQNQSGTSRAKPNCASKLEPGFSTSTEEQRTTPNSKAACSDCGRTESSGGYVTFDTTHPCGKRSDVSAPWPRPPSGQALDATRLLAVVRTLFCLRTQNKVFSPEHQETNSRMDAELLGVLGYRRSSSIASLARSSPTYSSFGRQGGYQTLHAGGT